MPEEQLVGMLVNLILNLLLGIAFGLILGAIVLCFLDIKFRIQSQRRNARYCLRHYPRVVLDDFREFMSFDAGRNWVELHRSKDSVTLSPIDDKSLLKILIKFKHAVDEVMDFASGLWICPLSGYYDRLSSNTEGRIAMDVEKKLASLSRRRPKNPQQLAELQFEDDAVIAAMPPFSGSARGIRSRGSQVREVLNISAYFSDPEFDLSVVDALIESWCEDMEKQEKLLRGLKLLVHEYLSSIGACE